MARPRAEIKQEEFEKLCSLMCTEEEIAGFFNVSSDTLNRWCKKTYRLSFFEVRSMKCSKGKIAIRRYQMRLAEKYPAMAIFLGKQYLEQKDHPEESVADSDYHVTLSIEDLSGGDDD